MNIRKYVNRKNISVIMLAVIVAVGFMVIPAGAAPKAPGKPTLVSTVASGENTIYVKWNYVKNADGYLVYRLSPGEKKYRGIIRVPKTCRLWKQTGLKPGNRYYFKVAAFKKVSQRQWYNKKTRKWQNSKPKRKWRGGIRTTTRLIYSAPSNYKGTITAKTTGATVVAKKPSTVSTSKVSVKAPDTPKSLTVTRTSGGIKLVAGSVSGASGYVFYRYNSNTAKKEQVANQAGATYTDTTALKSNWYQYSVKAYSSNGGAIAYSGEYTNSSDWPEGTALPGSTTTQTPINDGSISTTGGKVYPSADGTFTVTKGSNYSDPIKINGVNNPFTALYSSFPTGTTFRLDASEFKIESSNGNGVQTGHTGYDVTSISNRNVSRMMSIVDTDGGGLVFLASGTTHITFSNGKVMKFVVTGENKNMNSYVKYIDTFVNNNRSLSDYQFVQKALNEIWNNYKYDAYMDAHTTFLYKRGNCWGSNRLFMRMCVERGIPIRLYNENGLGGWHRSSVVTINGAEYYADATPESTSDFMVWSTYKTKYPSRTFTELKTNVAAKW